MAFLGDPLGGTLKHGAQARYGKYRRSFRELPTLSSALIRPASTVALPSWSVSRKDFTCHAARADLDSEEQASVGIIQVASRRQPSRAGS